MSDVFFTRPRIVWATQSATVHDRRFIGALVDSGWSVVFLSAEGNLKDLLVPPHHQPFVVADCENVFELPEHRMAERFEDVIASHRPELVWAGPLATVAHEIAKVTSIPLVAMSWGYDLLLDAATDPAIAAAISSTIRHARRVHVDCDAARKAAVELGALRECVVQFPWGVDLAAVPPRAPATHDDQPTIVSARSMEPVYDVATTIEAFALLTHQRPDITARLALIGSGSIEHELRSMAANLGVDSRIAWMGRLTESDVQRTLVDATVYVSSSHVDGSSVTLLQAMAAGLTPVVSDVGGNAEWVRSGETGLLFPAGDAPALAARLEECLGNPGLRNVLGSAARELVEQRGNWDVHRTTLIETCNALSGTS